MTQQLCVMLVAAEASGDDRGARLARALRQRLGQGVRFVGTGGEKLAAEGVASPFNIAELSIVGVFEGLLAYRRVMRRVADTAALAQRENPDVAVLIDSWGFTIRVARALRRAAPGLPLVKYVGPQVWAWRPGRARILASAVDHLLSINAVDPPYFAAAGLATTFVGDATLALDFTDADPACLRAEIGASVEAPILLVLPGSRPGELNRMLPPFLDAATILLKARPDLEVVIAAAATIAEDLRGRLSGASDRIHLIEGEELKRAAMKAATVALACSGTVTTELALAGCPFVVGYRLGPMTHAVLKPLLRTRYITLVNIAAGQEIARERLQGACTGPRLASDIAALLDDPAARRCQVEAQNVALSKMGRGGPNPSEAAADAILAILEAREA